jgi:integrase
MGRGPGVRSVGPEAIQVDFRWKGQRCRERIRLKPTPANLKYAARLKATIEHEIATGSFNYARHFPDSERAIRSSGVRLAAYLSAYVQGIAASVEPETAKEYRQSAEAVVEGIGNPEMQNLTRAQVRNWLASSPLSKKRLDNLLIPLRGALAQAVDDGILEKNILHGFRFKRIDSPRKEIDPFTPEEIEALGRVSNGNLWTFWAWTGLRSGEVIGLRWEDVDSQAGNVAVRSAIRLGRRKQPKTSAGFRLLCLIGPARDSLPNRPEGHMVGPQPVWTNPNTGKDWHEAKALARAFRKACKEAGVRYRYVYQLRHSFASRALSSGENPLWVARYMGHTDVGMVTRHYGKWIPSVDPLAGQRMLSKAERGQQAA